MLWVMETILESENHLFIYDSPSVLVENDLNLNRGEVVYRNIPNDLEFVYSENPADLAQDNIPANGMSGLLVSEAVKETFDAFDVSNIQFFPVKLTNLQGGKTLGKYYFANIIGIYSIVDIDKSIVEMCPVVKDMFFSIESLIFEEIEEDEYPPIFRLKEMPSVIIVNDLIKETIEKSNLTGFRFHKPEHYEA